MINSVLSVTELENLLKVKTTREQARQILHRNKALLEFVNQLPTTDEELLSYDGFELYDGSIGCPHCRECGCNICSWKILANLDEGEYAEYCLNIPFGGLTYKDLSSYSLVELNYGMNYESCVVGLFDIDKLTPIYFEELKNVKRFLQGHIEWAKAVLSTYGE